MRNKTEFSSVSFLIPVLEFFFLHAVIFFFCLDTGVRVRGKERKREGVVVPCLAYLLFFFVRWSTHGWKPA